MVTLCAHTAHNQEGFLTSGQMMVVIILAGTTMPPIPRLPMIKMIHRLLRLSVRATAMAPHPASY